MDYKVTINDFEGPLDLLLHLVRESNININDINISDITEQYLDYIKKMEELNLNIASSYLIMAASLIEMKSSTLLPKVESLEEVEEDPREELISKLLEYQRYKETTGSFRELEQERKEFYTKEPVNLKEYQNTEVIKTDNDVSLTDLLEAFQKFLDKKQLLKPLNTKIMHKEYSVSKRTGEIRNILKTKKRIEFTELFEIPTREYIIVTFLAILDLAKNQLATINQENNFDKIYLVGKE